MIKPAAFLLVVLMLSTTAYAGSFDEGKSAFDKGDMFTALKLLRPQAEQGNVQAECMVASIYWSGVGGVKEDDGEAVRWWGKAANQGDAVSQSALGNAYHSGTGVGRDDKEAMKWWLKAANLGNSSAEFNLGTAYYNGIGIAKDTEAGISWWKKASDQGDPDAQRNLIIAEKKPVDKPANKMEQATLMQGLYTKCVTSYRRH